MRVYLIIRSKADNDDEAQIYQSLEFNHSMSSVIHCL